MAARFTEIGIGNFEVCYIVEYSHVPDSSQGQESRSLSGKLFCYSRLELPDADRVSLIKVSTWYIHLDHFYFLSLFIKKKQIDNDC